jgi:hypothetical protein
VLIGREGEALVLVITSASGIREMIVGQSTNDELQEYDS